MNQQLVLSTPSLQTIQFDQNGLVQVIVQDHHRQKVLMFAWMNQHAFQATLDTGYAVYYSRSRAKLWRKGEESGNRQRVLEIRLDCDADVLLLQVEQIGSVACHTGRESCFFYRFSNQTLQWEITDPVIKNPNSMYPDQYKLTNQRGSNDS